MVIQYFTIQNSDVNNNNSAFQVSVTRTTSIDAGDSLFGKLQRKYRPIDEEKARDGSIYQYE